jgi:hypothetical protein
MELLSQNSTPTNAKRINLQGTIVLLLESSGVVPVGFKHRAAL